VAREFNRIPDADLSVGDLDRSDARFGKKFHDFPDPLFSHTLSSFRLTMI